MAKLKRERTRLSKMQDIAGCRILVEDGIADQDRVVEQLLFLFSGSHLDDTREKPRSGYRAAHLIVVVDQKAVEIQVRTQLQHRWAEVSEKGADLIDRAIKYGGGPSEVRKDLDTLSDLIRQIESLRGKVSADLLPNIRNLERRAGNALDSLLARIHAIVGAGAEP